MIPYLRHSENERGLPSLRGEGVGNNWSSLRYFKREASQQATMILLSKTIFVSSNVLFYVIITYEE